MPQSTRAAHDVVRSAGLQIREQHGLGLLQALQDSGGAGTDRVLNAEEVAHHLGVSANRGPLSTLPFGSIRLC